METGDLGREMLAGLMWIFRCLLGCGLKPAAGRGCAPMRAQDSLVPWRFYNLCSSESPWVFMPLNKRLFTSLCLATGGGWLADGSEEIDGRRRTFFSWAVLVCSVA